MSWQWTIFLSVLVTNLSVLWVSLMWIAGKYGGKDGSSSDS
jgi:hypothetical protein